ncbi:hypothetical protein NA57DRAFT_41146 [Rhizodiscina lignyota]|uniref:Uncharacterized protein n=1 Tax=Rhizodiscina lignyota TaxID=1504668 RepID=A0A9P4M7F9_9PEZI|nr:hypothetical protein NA57DRAFT_41146 [Rhizodiscina lignyota]
MHTCWRSPFARAFQQAARLRRQTVAARTFATPVQGPNNGSPFASNRSFLRSSPNTGPETPRETDSRIIKAQGKPIPVPSARFDTEAWIDSLELALPPHLRTTQPEDTTDETEYISSSIARHISLAYEDGHDLLTHLGVEQERWDAVVWIVNQLAEQGDPAEIATDSPTSSTSFSWHAADSLDKLTKASISINDLSLQSNGRRLREILQYNPRIANQGWTSHKGALGKVWRALGTMILRAARADEAESERIMPYVMQILAILHHNDIIPASIYRSAPPGDQFSVHQPPLLHMLSSLILTSLSDAAWKAQESTNAARSKETGAQYRFLGRGMPGLAFRGQLPTLRHEVWLELILWSCLHGRWIEEGASILRDTEAQSEESPWSLICQTQKVVESEETLTAQKASPLARLLGMSGEDKDDFGSDRVEKTISTEVVTAFVDGMLNHIRVGVGNRGVQASVALHYIQDFKRMLDAHDMGLGVMSWDAVIVRFLESEGVNAELNPGLLRGILQLAQPFTREVKLQNTPTAIDVSHKRVPYMFDPSASALGLFHRSIRGFVTRGDASGALKTFEQLQNFTDRNKTAAIRNFFEHSIHADFFSMPVDDFTSNVAELAKTYPSFHPQLPPRVLADLLNLTTTSKAYDFGRWLLYSDDVDGPLITNSSYADDVFAAALVRFGTATRDKELLSRVIESQSRASTLRHGHAQLNGRVMRAFLLSQIEFRRWESVENTLDQLRSRPDATWNVNTLAVLAREMLRMDAVPESESPPAKIFLRLCQGFYTPIRRREEENGWAKKVFAMDSILAFLSSLSPEWARLCKMGRRRSAPHPHHMNIHSFNNLLQGVADRFGCFRAHEIWKKWCTPLDGADGLSTSHQREHDFGMERMDRLVPSRGRGYDAHDNLIIVPNWTPETEPYVIYGRIMPNLTSIQIIIRGAATEIERMSWEDLDAMRDQYQELAQWAIAVLKSMGLRDEDVISEMAPLKLSQ